MPAPTTARPFNEAQDRFIYAEDATLQGTYFKLRLLDQSQNLTAYLDEKPESHVAAHHPDHPA
jgi:hypothetical protein